MSRILKIALLVIVACSLAFGASAPTPRDLLALGRIDEAIAVLRNRIATNPQDGEAYHLLSRAYFLIQRWDDAISNGERAINLKPDNSDFHMWLGRAYGEKADSSSFLTAAELAKKVRNQFERAVQLDGNNLPARSDLSEYYVSAPGFLGGGKDKARAQAEQLLNLDPATSHWIYGIIAEKDKKYDIAEQEFKAAIQASKEPAKRWLDLASFYRRRNRFPELEDAVNRALNVPGRQEHVLFDGAEILNRANRNFNGAIQLLRTYIASKDPSEEAPIFEAHYLLGLLLEKTGDKAGAAQEFRTTLSLAKDFQKAQSALKRVQ